MPVGNSGMLVQNFSSVMLPTQGITCPDSYSRGTLFIHILLKGKYLILFSVITFSLSDYYCVSTIALRFSHLLSSFSY
jgi:hypothetical protein